MLLAEVWVIGWGVVALAGTGSSFGLPLWHLLGLRWMGSGVVRSAALPHNDSGWKPKLLNPHGNIIALYEGNVGVPPSAEGCFYRRIEGAL